MRPNVVSPGGVAVVGAGCAGAVAALHLARAGLAPVLFERDPEPGASASCGGAMLSALEARLGLPPELVAARVRRVWLVERNGRRRLDFRRPPFVSVRRPRLDAHLAGAAVAAGAELRAGCRVGEWSPGDGTLSWTDGLRRDRQVFAAVVFADGPSSVARAGGLGLGRGAHLGSAFYRELEGTPVAADEVEFHLTMPSGDAGYLWVFPKGDRVQVGAGRLLATGPRPLRRVLDDLLAADERLCGLPRRIARGGIVPLSLARRTEGGGGMVVGDAAGLVNPITGGGLVYAVASGEMAARAVVEAAAGGRDGCWAGRRYAALLARSPHRLWLELQGVLFRWAIGRVRPGRSDALASLFRLHAHTARVVTPVAAAVTRRRRRSGR